MVLKRMKRKCVELTETYLSYAASAIDSNDFRPKKMKKNEYKFSKCSDAYEAQLVQTTLTFHAGVMCETVDKESVVQEVQMSQHIADVIGCTERFTEEMAQDPRGQHNRNQRHNSPIIPISGQMKATPR